MENSATENETEQSFRSPPRRRRSTFFERRDSIVIQNLTENVDPHTSKANNDEHEMHTQELSRYLDNLLLEKEQWKKEVNSRRNTYHDLRQQYQMAAKASSRSRMSYSALSNEDIEFLKGKPAISKLIECQQELHKSVKNSQEVFRRLNDLNNVILEQCEDKIDKITEYILENSTVEPME